MVSGPAHPIAHGTVVLTWFSCGCHSDPLPPLSVCLSPYLSLLSGFLVLSAHLVLPSGSNLGLPAASRRIS